MVSDESVCLLKLAGDQHDLYSLVPKCVDPSSQTYERIGIVRQDIADLARDADLLVFDGSQEETLVNIV